jgi:TonB-dependent receptor
MLGKKLLACSVSAMALMTGAAMAQSDQVETVVVTGIRATIAQGLDIKRGSTQVVESVIAEDIGKLPDNNIVEALQRLSGVQVTDRGSGQVGKIYIRGLDDIETTWNGRKMFTSSGLYFSMQDMPATLVRRLDVYKTRESNQIESGIAGQLDIASYRPFDFDGFKLTAQATATYQDKRGATDPNLGLLVSDRWKTSIGDVGVLANLSWSVVRYRDESSTPGALVPFATETPPAGSGYTPLQRIFNGWPAGTLSGLPEASGSTMMLNGVATPYYLSRDAVFQSDFTGKRTRPNANVAMQWAPDEHSTYTLEMMYNGFRNESYNNLMFSFVDWWGDFVNTSPNYLNPVGSVTTYTGTNVLKTRTVRNVYDFNSGDLTSAKTNNYAYALNGKWDYGRFKASADLSYQASQNESIFTAMRVERTAPEINVDFNSGGGIMAFNFGSTQNRLTDPSFWNTAQLYDNANYNKGEAYTLKLDSEYDLAGMLPFLKSVKFGLRHDNRNAQEAYRQASGYLSKPMISLNSDALYYNSGFFDGVSDVPHSWVNLKGRWVHDNIGDLRTLYGGDLTNSRLHEMFQTFKITEMTTAAYLDTDFEQDVLGRPLTLNAGVRWVQVKDNMTFFDHTQFLVDGSHNMTTGSNYAAKWLPSATLAYEPTDDVKLRASYGETLRRPAFTQLNPTYILNADVTNVGHATGTHGNPDLQPTHSKNIDLTAEWYFAPSSAFYVTAFRRDLDNIVVPMNVAMVFPGDAIKNQYNTNNFIIVQPMNASKGSQKGVELGFTYFPDFLPSYLDGFGAQGSLTVLSSNQMTPDTDPNTGKVVSEFQESMWGVSPLSYNITAIYEKGDVGARVSYVWRSKFHNNNEAASFANPLGIWRRAEASLDFQLSYKPWDGVMVTFDGTNLLNGKQKQYYRGGGQGDPDVTDFGTALFSRTFSVGLHYSTN